MPEPASKSVSERILVCAPFGRDGALIEREMRSAGLMAFQCSSLKNLCRCVRNGAGAALICDHALDRNGLELLSETLSKQEPWSQLPVLVLTAGGSTNGQTRGLLRELQPIRNLTLLERPLRPYALVSNIQAAIRTRRHQYQIRDDIRRLEESEKTLQTYLDNTGDGIYIVEHRTGRILDVNHRAVERLKYSRDELLRMSLPDLFVERKPIKKALRDFWCRQAQGTVQLEATKRRKNGSTFPVEVRMKSLAPKLPAQVMAVMHDITERKKLEQVQAEEARRKDEFLALLGHEMRNPLAAISGAIAALSGKCTEPRRDELRQGAARQVTLMRRLLDDLLDLNRITRGRLRLKKERIELAEFLQKAALLMEAPIANRCQELLLRLPARSVAFKADRARLTQIVGNLLSNASKYTPPGGRIELSGIQEGSEIVLRCKDNGQGVLPEHMVRIFEPFTRGPNPHDSYGESSLGIGLALVKQLVELHGGDISVESPGAGLGSTFTVRLPLLLAGPVKPGAAGAMSDLTGWEPRSVMLVEDNPNVASAMQAALQQAGQRVHVFPDGPSALAGAARLRPDAVVLDIGLPGIDGYELAAKLKSRKTMRKALFIAVSGFERRLDAETQGAEFDHYFVKPVEVKTLLSVISTQTGGRANREAARKPEEPAAPKRRARLRVLVVDDYHLIADTTAELLRDEGTDARTALTGREALELAKTFRPHLLLCDLRLGDMKGLDVIRELRSNPSTRRVHAVIVSGLSETEIRALNQRAKELGVDEFVSKPVELDMIRKLLANLRSN